MPPPPSPHPDGPVPGLAVLVLAGGRSRRFGADKLEAAVGSGRLLDASLSVAAAVSSAVVAVCPDERVLPVGVQRVQESPAYAGPFAAVVAGLAALSPGPVGRVLVIAGDLLDPMPAVVALLAAFDRADPSADEGGIDVAVAVDELGRRQPLLALYDVAALRLTTDGVDGTDRPARALLDGLRVLEVAVPPGSSTDVDTPADLPDSSSS